MKRQKTARKDDDARLNAFALRHGVCVCSRLWSKYENSILIGK